MRISYIGKVLLATNFTDTKHVVKKHGCLHKKRGTDNVLRFYACGV